MSFRFVMNYNREIIVEHHNCHVENYERYAGGHRGMDLLRGDSVEQF